jgi:hypothetical protein
MTNLPPFFQQLAQMILQQSMRDSSPLAQAQVEQTKQQTASSQQSGELAQQKFQQDQANQPAQVEYQTQQRNLLGAQILERLNPILNPPGYGQYLSGPPPAAAVNQLIPGMAELFQQQGQASQPGQLFSPQQQ